MCSCSWGNLRKSVKSSYRQTSVYMAGICSTQTEGYIPGIYCHPPRYISPTTWDRNQKISLIYCWGVAQPVKSAQEDQASSLLLEALALGPVYIVPQLSGLAALLWKGPMGELVRFLSLRKAAKFGDVLSDLKVNFKHFKVGFTSHVN